MSANNFPFDYSEPRRDMLTNVTTVAMPATAPILVGRFDYILDDLGRRVQRVDSESVTNAFSYNARSEIISATFMTNMFGYSYDSIGNRLWAAANVESNDYTANNLNQYYLITNQLSQIGNDLGYDADGNLTNDSVLAYSWDGENRLVQVEPLNLTNGAKRIRNLYDYMSRRVEKVVDTWDGSAWTGYSTNRFLYDGWNLICEERSTLAAPPSTNYYVWGQDLSGTLQGAGGVGGLLAVVQNGATYFPCYDANGNISDYVDTNGTVLAHREYDAYGNTIVATGPMVNDFHFWFSTKYLDQETGLYYYGYRYYSPSLGRFLSRDPIGEEGAKVLKRFSRDPIHRRLLNRNNSNKTDLFLLYSFVKNNPLSKVDSLGERIYKGRCSYIGVSYLVFGFGMLTCDLLSEDCPDTCNKCKQESCRVVAFLIGAAAGSPIPVEVWESDNRFEITGTCANFAGIATLKSIGGAIWTYGWSWGYEITLGNGISRGMFEPYEGLDFGVNGMFGKARVSKTECVASDKCK